MTYFYKSFQTVNICFVFECITIYLFKSTAMHQSIKVMVIAGFGKTLGLL